MARLRFKVLSSQDRGDHANHLTRRLSWPHLLALGVGAIVGTGIYTLIGVGADRAGPGVILAFLIAGAVCACAALAYAELATMMPEAGGAYTYTYVGLGEVAAWFVGWSLVLEYSVACSAVGVGWSGYVVGALAGIGIDLPTALRAGPHAGGIVNLPAVLIVLAVATLLMRGVHESARLNAILVAIKLAALVLFAALTVGAFRAANFSPFLPYGFLSSTNGGETRGVMTAAAVVFFAFFGFDAVATAAEEAKRPERDIAIGIVGSIAVCTVIYMAIAAVAIGAVPFGAFARDPAPLAMILRVLGHPVGATLISVAAVVALPTVILVMMYGQTRVAFAMARDGLLPQRLAHVSGSGAPRIVTGVVAIAIATVAGFLPLDEIAELTNAGTLVAFVAVSICVLILRRRARDHVRNFRFPAAWVLAPLAAAGCFYLFCSLPWLTIVRFILWNALGFVLYFAHGRRTSKWAGHRITDDLA